MCACVGCDHATAVCAPRMALLANACSALSVASPTPVLSLGPARAHNSQVIRDAQAHGAITVPEPGPQAASARIALHSPTARTVLLSIHPLRARYCSPFTHCAHGIALHSPTARTVLLSIHPLRARYCSPFSHCAHGIALHSPTARTVLLSIHPLRARYCKRGRAIPSPANRTAKTIRRAQSPSDGGDHELIARGGVVIRLRIHRREGGRAGAVEAQLVSVVL